MNFLSTQLGEYWRTTISSNFHTIEMPVASIYIIFNANNLSAQLQCSAAVRRVHNKRCTMNHKIVESDRKVFIAQHIHIFDTTKILGNLKYYKPSKNQFHIT